MEAGRQNSTNCAQTTLGLSLEPNVYRHSTGNAKNLRLTKGTRGFARARAQTNFDDPYRTERVLAHSSVRKTPNAPHACDTPLTTHRQLPLLGRGAWQEGGASGQTGAVVPGLCLDVDVRSSAPSSSLTGNPKTKPKIPRTRTNVAAKGERRRRRYGNGGELGLLVQPLLTSRQTLIRSRVAPSCGQRPVKASYNTTCSRTYGHDL